MAREDYPTGYIVVQATIPDSIQISKIEFSPPQSELIGQTRQAGDLWLASHRSSVLEVPSFVVPGESNYLLNPLHPEFHHIVVSMPAPFHFDVRLFNSRFRSGIGARAFFAASWYGVESAESTAIKAAGIGKTTKAPYFTLL